MSESTMRNLLDLSDAGGNAIAAMINDAQDRKAARKGWAKARALQPALAPQAPMGCSRGAMRTVPPNVSVAASSSVLVNLTSYDASMVRPSSSSSSSSSGSA